MSGPSYARAFESYFRYVERLEAALLSGDPKRIALARRMVKRRKVVRPADRNTT